MTDLLDLTAQLVGIPSVSRSEDAIGDRIAEELAASTWLSTERIGPTVVARSALGHARRVVLAGHMDTVPPDGNAEPRIDGDCCTGVGSVDMKGGLAVLLVLAKGAPPVSCDVTFVFYSCEEVDRSENSLRKLAADRPELLDCDVAVLAEPTGCVVEAGCQGSMRFEVTLTGIRAHTARPWTGRNAIHRMGRLLALIDGYQGRTPVIDGCEYRESLQAVGISGGVAGNVVPDAATVTVNHRFAPDRSVEEATEAVQHLLSPVVEVSSGDHLRVVDASSGAPPGLSHPTLRRLVDASGRPPRAKLGLTDVSLFTELGVPATNFGPGDPLLAHGPGERVSRTELEGAYGVLGALIGAHPR